MTSEEFVRGVMERLGANTAAELAEKMRWKRGAERTVARWLSGDSQPSFDYVIDMVERAGLPNSSVQGIVSPDGDDPSAQADREQLAENDARILENQNQAMSLLQEIHKAVAIGAAGERTAATRSRRKA